MPAPSGGVALPGSGYDAVHTYRIHVERAGVLTVRLHIAGSGRISDHQDLDLALLDMRADPIDSSAGETANETISRAVQPGYVIARVHDGGDGNRADYTIEAHLE